MTDVTTPSSAAPPAPPAASPDAVGAPGAARHRARFHALTVASVERLTDEAVAVTFEVPDGLVDEFAFEPGQHLTLRATIRGEDVRQSYSICQSRHAPGMSRRGGCPTGSTTVCRPAMSWRS